MNCKELMSDFQIFNVILVLGRKRALESARFRPKTTLEFRILYVDRKFQTLELVWARNQVHKIKNRFRNHFWAAIGRFRCPIAAQNRFKIGFLKIRLNTTTWNGVNCMKLLLKYSTSSGFMVLGRNRAPIWARLRPKTNMEIENPKTAGNSCCKIL